MADTEGSPEPPTWLPPAPMPHVPAWCGPHHQPVQHQDGKAPWCNRCQRDVHGVHRAELPSMLGIKLRLSDPLPATPPRLPANVVHTLHVHPRIMADHGAVWQLLQQDARLRGGRPDLFSVRARHAAADDYTRVTYQLQQEETDAPH